MVREVDRLVDDLVSQFAIHFGSEYVSGMLIIPASLLDLIKKNEEKILDLRPKVMQGRPVEIFQIPKDPQIYHLLRQRISSLSEEEWVQ